MKSYKFEDLRNAPRLQPYQVHFYKGALNIALLRKVVANDFEMPSEGKGLAINGKYPEIIIHDTPARDYWGGFIQGLNARIQCNLDYDGMENLMSDYTIFKSEYLKGKIAGYMFFELISTNQGMYDPPIVEGLDGSPIRSRDFLPDALSI